MFVGNDFVFSMNERDASKPRARKRVRALNSVTSFVKSRRYVDHRRVVFTKGFNIERHDDRVVVCGLDRARHGKFRIGDYVIDNIPQQDAIPFSLPSHYAIACCLTTITNAERSFGDLADPKKFFVQFALWDFVIDLFLDRVNRENSFIRFRFFGDHTIVRLDFRLLIGTAGAVLTSTAPAGGAGGS